MNFGVIFFTPAITGILIMLQVKGSQKKKKKTRNMKAKDTNRKKKKRKTLTQGLQTDLQELLLVWEWSWGSKDRKSASVGSTSPKERRHIFLFSTHFMKLECLLAFKKKKKKNYRLYPIFLWAILVRGKPFYRDHPFENRKKVYASTQVLKLWT